jgi:Lyzozyme M1 (1,4-beta-N-acetylmuramidase)
MISLRPLLRSRRALVTGTSVAAAALSIMTGLPATAAPVGLTVAAVGSRAVEGNAPTAAARAAGITKAGEAYMGWNERHLSMTAAVKSGRLVVPPPTLTSTVTTVTTTSTSSVEGMDVSGWQGTVDWASWYRLGRRFAYVKATEGSSYRSSTFSAQYTGSYKAGMIRGAYHFAVPSGASGTVQADYFLAHGGGWSNDGKTLPGMLDIEWNPYGPACYGKTPSQLVAWVTAFVKEYKYKTGRDAVIYTAASYWKSCLGNATTFAYTDPLVVANYSTSAPTLFGGWPYFTFRQYTDTPLDLDRFYGTYARLQALALG